MDYNTTKVFVVWTDYEDVIGTTDEQQALQIARKGDPTHPHGGQWGVHPINVFENGKHIWSLCDNNSFTYKDETKRATIRHWCSEWMPTSVDFRDEPTYHLHRCFCGRTWRARYDKSTLGGTEIGGIYDQ